MSSEPCTLPPAQSEGGIERVKAVAAALGVLELATKVAIVGGTNGKGSTVAFLEAIAKAAGLRVGTYTTPHIVRYNESVRIEGREVGDLEFLRALHRVKAASLGVDAAALALDPREFASPASIKAACLGGSEARIPLFPYELLTLATLVLFKDAALDLVVLEVGMGGRWDAVNVIDADVALVTTVDLDHVGILGTDRDTIGVNKAGIARAGRPLVVGERSPPPAMMREIERRGATPIRAGHEFDFEKADGGWCWRRDGRKLSLPMPSLLAPVQLANAAAAIAAMLSLYPQLAEDVLATGVSSANLPGRLQRLHRGDADVFVDIGHNPQAAKELAAWAAGNARAGRLLAVFGIAGDKDVEGIAAELAGTVDRWYLAGMHDKHKRELGIDGLAERMQSVLDPDACSKHDTIEEALARVYADATRGDQVLIFGSPEVVKAALLEAR
jgi:dihydrofolate synthase/folylpolyglutamate synthase